MRWYYLCGTLALLAITGGCKQACFMTESDFNRTTTTLLEGMEDNPALPYQPLTQPCPPPPTLDNLDRRIRYIGLNECVAIALEQGRVGQPSLLFPGTAQDNLVQFAGGGGRFGALVNSDAIRVFALQPAQTGAVIEEALSRFDAVFSADLTYNTVDQPLSSGFNTDTNNRQSVNAIASFVKPLATGGTAQVGMSIPYSYTSASNPITTRFNPQYQPRLQFGFDQPLLQGFGVEINQLRERHPVLGSSLNIDGVGANRASQFQPATEGILITRLRFDQQRAEFERQVNQMLLNVETAYWNLYGTYWTLYSREQALRFAFEALKVTKGGYEAGRLTAADYYQSRGQYEQFRAQRLQALDQVLENERQLRSLLGMPTEDGTRLMPSDSPTLAPYRPDWNSARADAIARRPELYMARMEIKALQMQLRAERNQLLPDVRFQATYDFNGLGNRLDGSTSDLPVGQAGDVNALRNLTDGNFSTWTIALTANIPLGFRLAHARIRQQQIALSRAIEILKDQELKAESFLYNYYHRLGLEYEQIKANRATRESFGELLRARQQQFLAGRITPDLLFEAQRFWADALANEYQAVVRYNNALIGFEFAKGTIMQHDNVFIAEGPLPQCAQVRAVEHERQRTAAIVCRERAKPAVPPLVTRDPIGSDGRAFSLPAVTASTPFLDRDLPAPVLPEGAIEQRQMPHGTIPTTPAWNQPGHDGDELRMPRRTNEGAEREMRPMGNPPARRPANFGTERDDD